MQCVTSFTVFDQPRSTISAFKQFQILSSFYRRASEQPLEADVLQRAVKQAV